MEFCLLQERRPGRKRVKLSELVNGQLHQVIFSLQPIICFMPRLTSTLKVDLVSAGSDLVSCWVIDFHGSACFLSEFVGTHNLLVRCSVGISGIRSSDRTRLSWLPRLLLRGEIDLRCGLTSFHACLRFRMTADHLRG